ncbi:peptide chain release factor N(5)-glutamine methyltransferase [bacterium]|nr:peptide chain release factor N(5)-glutamine methyltransferase [bacterium]MDA7866853.1 peptide chain release factor N(5)-glutamine methyltransferase [Verrucomicrobiota bacterium]
MKTIGDVLREGKERFLAAGVPESQADIEWLLEHVTGIKRLELSLCVDRQLVVDEEALVNRLIVERCQRVPLQHLIGNVPFLGHEIRVSPEALIPRSETEMLAELALSRLGDLKRREGIRVLDIGTGTGCLPIAIAKAREDVEVVAVDISTKALSLAKENIRAHQLEHRIELIESDLFAQVGERDRFDLIVSNPPYIPLAEIATLQEEVRDYDPHLALDGGLDGLDFYRSIAQDAPDFVRGDGMALLEFGDGQENEVRRIFENALWQITAFHRDLNDKPRIIEVHV